jgi:hypothetical protein
MPEIGPEEIHVVTLFLNLSTQWHRAGVAAVRTGIDYGVVPAVAGMLNMTIDADRLSDLRTMEHEALICMATSS